MQLFVLGLVAGALLGARGPSVMKAAGRGARAAADKARELTRGVREGFREVMEEAREEIQQERRAALAASAGEAEAPRRRASRGGRRRAGEAA